MMGRETGVPVDRVIADGLSAANILRDVFAALNDRALHALPGPPPPRSSGKNPLSGGWQRRLRRCFLGSKDLTASPAFDGFRRCRHTTP
jgi:hypothetical protein